MNIRSVLLVALVLLCCYAALSFYKSGETLKTMTGKVEKCEVLGGAADSMFHATIKSASGSYIIANLRNCRPGSDVTILIKRGALYFNTVYAAEQDG